MGNYTSTLESTVITQPAVPVLSEAVEIKETSLDTLIPAVKRVYNWQPSRYNPTHMFLKFNTKPASLPEKIDLTEDYAFPPIYDQGQLGSCTSCAVCGCYGFDTLNDGNASLPELKTFGPQEEFKSFEPSIKYLYQKALAKENHTGIDAGAIIDDEVEQLKIGGVCSSQRYPYDEDITTVPSPECDEEATHHKCIESKKILRNVSQMKSCLAVGKRPFVFGFMVYDEFEAMNGSEGWILSLPKTGSKLLGGHSVVAIGYCDETKLFKIRNSWGEKWGDKGYFYMPYNMISNEKLCSDFTCLQKVKDD